MKLGLILALCAVRLLAQGPNYNSILNRPVISVTGAPFFAKGDGIHLDGPAVQAAITAAKAVSGIAFFPPGTYNMGTTNIATGVLANGLTLQGSPGGTVLSWTVGASGTALTIGASSATSYYPSLSGLRLISASATQNLLNLSRTHNASLANMELEGPVSTAGRTTKCITLDAWNNDLILTTLVNVECTHVFKGIVAQSTGGGFNNVTTVNTLNFGVNADQEANAMGVDFGAVSGSNWTFTGGFCESLVYCFTSSGGAGLSMEELTVVGMDQDQNVTALVNLEAFAQQNVIIAQGNNTFTGAGLCVRGNQIFGATAFTCVNGQMIVRAVASGTTPLLIDQIPNASTAPIIDTQLASGGVHPYQINSSGGIGYLGSNPTLWTVQADPRNAPISAPVGSFMTAPAGAPGQVGFLQESGTTGWHAIPTINAGSSTISTGVGSLRMSTTNAGTNTAWIQVNYSTGAGSSAVGWVPVWTTNAP